MKLFKKLASSMMCLLLAVIVFAGCSGGQLKQSKFDVPNDSEFTKVTSEKEVEEAITLLANQATAKTIEENAGVPDGNGSIEEMIKSAKLSISISRLDKPVVFPQSNESTAEEGLTPGEAGEGTTPGETEIPEPSLDFSSVVIEILDSIRGSIHITGIMQLNDGSIQIALGLDSDVHINYGEFVTITLDAEANIYYNKGSLYAKVIISNNANKDEQKIEKYVKVALPILSKEEAETTEELDIINKLYFGVFDVIDKINAGLSDVFTNLTGEEREQLIERFNMAGVFKAVKKSKTTYKIVFNEEMLKNLPEFDNAPVGSLEFYLEFNKNKLTKIYAQTTVFDCFEVQLVLEKYTKAIDFPSFKNYEEVENLEAFKNVFSGLFDQNPFNMN